MILFKLRMDLDKLFFNKSTLYLIPIQFACQVHEKGELVSERTEL